MSQQPRIRGNDWGALVPPEPGSWTPRLSVSVVIPAYRAQRTLEYTLGALGAQTYPTDLTEVIVVDDGDDDPVPLPDNAPVHTRVIRPNASWGRANACHTGALHAVGEVIHWLDADMVPLSDEVERQLRWHHIIDYAVVLGHKTFVDPEELPERDTVVSAVREGRVPALLAGRWQAEHDWVDEFWRETDELRLAGFRGYQVHVGASASVRRDFYLSAGGMDTSLRLAEDVELGFRLQQRGAVFVADRSATSLHLGRTTLMRWKDKVERHNAPYVAQRIPDLRRFRRLRGREYAVPYVEVVIDVRDRSAEDVRHTVEAFLRGRPGDVVCLLVGAWESLGADGRRDVLVEPHLDLRMTSEEFAHDSRVRLVTTVEPSAFPVPHRFYVPAGWAPSPETMEALLRDMRERSKGLYVLDFPDGSVARLEVTAAMARAALVAGPGDSLDDVVDAVSGVVRSDAVEQGFYDRDGTPTSRAMAPMDTPIASSRGKSTRANALRRILRRWVPLRHSR